VERRTVQIAAAGIGVAVAAGLLLWWMSRRVRATSAALRRRQSAVAPSEPAVSWDIPADAETAPTSQVLDDAFSHVSARPVLAPVAAVHEGTDGNEAMLATLAAPWGSIDEAVEAIRHEILHPPVKPPPPPPPEPVKPLSLDEISPAGESSLEFYSAPAKPKAHGTVDLGLGGVEQPAPKSFEVIDAEEMFFGAAPEEKPPAAKSNLSLDVDTAPPMTTDDVLSPPPSRPPRPSAETTGQPLNLNDLLGPPPPVPEADDEILSLDATPVSAPTGPRRASGPPPGPAVPFDPEQLEETIQLPRPTESSITLVLPPAEMQKVLREVPPPTESMGPVLDLGGEGAGQGEPDDAEGAFMDNYRRGLAAREQRDWAKAIRHFEEALRVRPDSSEVLRLLRAAQEAERRRKEGGSPSPFTPGL
jgi:hypothetical protein